MSEGNGHADPPEQADLVELARDWITLWQSELGALATDREAQEAWQTLISLWAGAAGALLGPASRGSPAGSGERADRHAGAAAAAGAAPAAPAPEPRDTEIERLRSRVDMLERRLADIERDGRSAIGNARRGNGGRAEKPKKS
jgi:hypothetical protein